MKPLRFWFDLLSPCAYLAWRQEVVSIPILALLLVAGCGAPTTCIDYRAGVEIDRGCHGVP